MADESGSSFFGDIAKKMSQPPEPLPWNRSPERQQANKELGAKISQSASMGFEADIQEMLNKGRGEEIRKLSNQYDMKHPLAGLALDVGIGIAESAVASPIKAVGLMGATGKSVAAAAGGLAGRTAVGGATGAVMGAGRGGDADTRAENATTGAIEGAAASLGLGLAGKLIIKPLFDRLGTAGFSQAKAAADDIKKALAKGGKSIQDLNKFLTDNPGARVVDFFSGKAKDTLTDLVAQAGSKSKEVGRMVSTAVEKDMSQLGKRIEGATGKLTTIKNDMLDQVKKITQERDSAYAKANETIAPLTDDLKAMLRLPSVAPLWKEVQSEIGEKFKMGQTTFGKYNASKEAPVQALDELQRRLTAMGEDFLGSAHKGTLDKMARVASERAGPALTEAQYLASQAGAMERGQTWGHDFAKALKTGSMEEFGKLSDLGKEHAKLGVITGLEDYLTNHQRIGQSGLLKISDFLKTDEMASVLGRREAAQASKVFKNEAARAKVNTELLQGQTGRSEFLKEKGEMVGAAAVNAVAPGKIGTIFRFLNAQGFSEERAKNIVQIAMSPNGMKKLKDAGVKQNVLDKVMEATKTGGAAPARAAVGTKKQVTESDE